MSDAKEKEDELTFTERVFNFLQGTLPEGTFVPKKEIPKLTPDQAWTVIWFLGNERREISDHVERCEVCGSLYDSWNAGDTLDYGKSPYSFCDNCMNSEEYAKKMKRNPDKETRRQFFEH